MAIERIVMFNLAAVMVMFLGLWLVSLARRDASIVDIFWGLGYVLVAWLTMWASGDVSPRSLLLTTLVSVWGLRLSGYLAYRNWGQPEDRRYGRMRERWGGLFPLVSLFTVFGLQALLVWVISLPIQVGMASASAWHAASAVGVVLWMLGLFFEAVGDYQLARFKAQPANQGKVMDRGLWRYTRHPNYFGDFLVWWGFYLIAVEPGSWWWTFVGPLLMSFLLIYVSGVRLLESSLRGRVDGYGQYARRTSAFFPWPPKPRSLPE